MSRAIAMPKLGLKMEEGTVLEWRARPGDRVDKGQVIAVIESDKAEAEIEAPAPGFLRHIYVEPEATVPCGACLAALTDAADEPFDAAGFQAQQASAAARAAPHPARPAAPRPPAEGGAPRAGRPRAAPVTPAARRRARELSLDPARVPGTGPGGRVTREDVDAFAVLDATRVEVAPGVRLEAPVQGAGDPVVLLPGFGADTSAFARQLPALVEGYRVRVVSPRGVGLSDAPEAESYPVAGTAADVAGLIAEPTHLVGASLGAAAALELALEHPERVRSLALVTPFVTATPRLLAVIDAWCRLAAADDADTLARALLPWLFGPRILDDERARRRALRGLAETAGRVPAPALERSGAGLRAWSGTREGALDALDCPILVVGASEDLLTPDAERIAAALPRAACSVVEGAGHAVAIEAADAVNAALLEHLGRS